MGFESERETGVDHNAEHGDRNEGQQLQMLAQILAFIDGTVAIDLVVARCEASRGCLRTEADD